MNPSAPPEDGCARRPAKDWVGADGNKGAPIDVRCFITDGETPNCQSAILPQLLALKTFNVPPSFVRASLPSSVPDQGPSGHCASDSRAARPDPQLPDLGREDLVLI